MRPWIVSNKNSLIRNAYSVGIALLPVISFYRFLFADIGLSMAFLLLSIPYPIMIMGRKKHVSKECLVLFAFLLYLVIRSAGNYKNMVLWIIVFIHLSGAFNGTINELVLKKVIISVAVISTVAVIFQTVVHYCFHYDLVLISSKMVLEENIEAVLNQYNRPGLFRPCAFFLEPAHFSSYCSVAIVITLLSTDKFKSLVLAIVISIGCVLTTSGIGIFLCICIFGWFILQYKMHLQNKILIIVFAMVLAATSFAFMCNFEFFRLAIQRVFGKVDGYNAIWGRTLHWPNVKKRLDGSSWLVGMGTLNVPAFYRTGIMDILLCYGCIGCLLVLGGTLLLGIKGGQISFCMSIIFIGLNFVANQMGFISMAFWIGLIVAFSKKRVGER